MRKLPIVLIAIVVAAGLASAQQEVSERRQADPNGAVEIENLAGSVEVVDWNGDGKKDLFIGGEYGWTYYFERSFIEGNLPHARVDTLEVRP